MRFAEVLSWRWTPAFALVGGSLVFVLLAIALVPDQLGPRFSPQPGSSASGHGRFGRAPGSAVASATGWGGHVTTAAAPSAAEHEHAPPRPERRVRRALAPGETPPYLDHTMSRLFNRGIPRQDAQDAPPEGAAPPVPAAPAPEPPQNTEAPAQPAPNTDAPPQGQGAVPNAEAPAQSAPN